MRMTVADSLAQIPATRRWATVFTRGSLEVEIYAPRGSDPQTPHRKDELYVVVTGSGTFVAADVRTSFGPGDCLFAAAGVVHRFVDFTDDLVVWVVFYGPDGGEGGQGNP